jgi:hypothetical protein
VVFGGHSLLQPFLLQLIIWLSLVVEVVEVLVVEAVREVIATQLEHLELIQVLNLL